MRNFVEFSQHTVYVAAALAAIFGILAYLAEADDRVLEREARIALLTNSAWETLSTGTSTRAQTEAFRTLLALGIDFDGAEIDELQLTGLDLSQMAIADFRVDDFALIRMTADGMRFENWTRKSNDSRKSWRIEETSLRGADFSNSIFVFTSFETVDLANANFRGTDLWQSRFETGDLRDADFRETALVSAVFRNVDLRGANFEGAKERVPFILGADPLFENTCMDDTTVMPEWWEGEKTCPAGFFTEEPAWRARFDSLETQEVRPFSGEQPWYLSWMGFLQ